MVSHSCEVLLADASAELYQSQAPGPPPPQPASPPPSPPPAAHGGFWQAGFHRLPPARCPPAALRAARHGASERLPWSGRPAFGAEEATEMICFCPVRPSLRVCIPVSPTESQPERWQESPFDKGLQTQPAWGAQGLGEGNNSPSVV